MSRPPCLAQSNRPSRDIVFRSRPLGGHPMSQHHIGVATPSLLPSLKPGRDTRTKSRSPGRPTYVATSFSCRDLTHCCPCRDINPCRDFNSQQARSRRKFHVVTSWRLTHVTTSTSCRDLLSTTVRFPGRDANIQVATSHIATHVATSK